MKEKIIKFLKEKIFIIIFIILIAIILVIFCLNKITIKEYKNDKYTLKYDSSWKLKEKKDDVILKHGKSELSINLVSLSSNDKFLEISEMADKILYDIGKQNSNYKLLKKEKTLVSKQKYSGYQALYENEKSQAIVTMAKVGDKLVVFTYKSPNKDFDILLDSVSNIIYNFKIENEKFDLKTKLDLKLSKINFTDNSQSVDKIKDYNVSANNYSVNYSVPSNFELNSLNSSYQSFTFKGFTDFKQTISLNASILNRNIYEYLDKDKSASVFSMYSSYKKQNEDFEETIGKLDDKTFVYKNTYDDKIYENVVLIYELDKDHIFYISLSARNTPISKNIIDLIKMKDFKNYSVYTDSKIEEGQRISRFKYFSDYNKENIKVISLKLPLKYKEVEKTSTTNIFENRLYGLNYDEKLEINDYDLEYKVTGNKEESYIKVLNDSLLTNDTYGKPKSLEKSKDKQLNGKTFKVYEGGHYGLAGTFFTSINRVKYFKEIKLLMYDLGDGKQLAIKISGNGKQISDDLLKEVTNFNIDLKEK